MGEQERYARSNTGTTVPSACTVSRSTITRIMTGAGSLPSGVNLVQWATWWVEGWGGGA
jgi:hypothetical protein